MKISVLRNSALLFLQKNSRRTSFTGGQPFCYIVLLYRKKANLSKEIRKLSDFAPF
jgi:hypothetical protein